MGLKIIGVDVFLERRKTRFHVGVITRAAGNFTFTYNERYFQAKNIIPLGPELPLTQRTFSSKTLFPSLVDRIPSKQNPAYPEYCAAVGIDPQEKDPLVLLATIGRRGPSSFVFHPLFERATTAKDVIAFRKRLGLTTREFASVFEFAQSSLNALEKNRSTGSEIQKRLQIIMKFPEVALDFLTLNGGYLAHGKWVKALRTLKTPHHPK